MSAHLHPHWGRSLSALPSPVLQTKNIYLPTEDLRRGTRLMVSISSQMQGCRALAPVPIYPLLLGMLCSAQVPTETMNWGQWALMHGNMILLPGQADSWGRQTLAAVLRQACQRLKANHSPVARESTLNIKPVRSPSLTKWFWMQEHLPSKVWEGFCKKLWFCYIHIFLKEK